MAYIKVVTGGCGIKYTDEHGNKRHVLKTAENGPFECDDEHAGRLVRLGVAVYVLNEAEKPVALVEETAAPVEQQEEIAPETSGEHLDPAQLEEMPYNDLKKLAADMGAKPKGKTKADYIAAIVAAEVEPGEEDPEDELPELTAVDPE